MAHFALTYGSLGDLLETAKLTVKVVRLLRADGRTKLSQERLALATKLQTLNRDLITLDSIAAGVHIDLSSTHTLLVVIRVRAEVEACRMVLAQFLDRLAAPRGFLGSIMVTLSEESELTRFKTEFSSPMKRAVADNMFCVIDPVGGNIPILLRYCHLYSDLDRIIKAYLGKRQEAGGLYVQRGDYNIVSLEGSIIFPMEFAETVNAGIQVEMSIIKRTFHAWRERRAPISGTSPLKTDEAAEWFVCASPTCRRKYEHSGALVSPEVAQDRSAQESLQPEVFRLVQDYTVQIKVGKVRLIFGTFFFVLSRAMMLTARTLEPVHGEVKGLGCFLRGQNRPLHGRALQRAEVSSENETEPPVRRPKPFEMPNFFVLDPYDAQNGKSTPTLSDYSVLTFNA
ncbi:hypothetical protein B0H13DRAFT_1888829 [Mycena leptocephala]|nr:hypothetical protein B0H13DRAFT_1888829 [Mycena leptocephala]